MPDQPPVYYVTLREDGESIAPEFRWHDLPTPGFLFEHESRKYRVVEVCALVPPAEGEGRKVIECDVVEAYRWNPTQNRWLAVVP
ncbi:hypothetical protein ACFY64_32110 [Streptomyces collinus]|uniref:hypothetical protein n=1 Tax=Streptomyces collinus TaxID=42684 RepID=UPI00369373FD